VGRIAGIAAAAVTALVGAGATAGAASAAPLPATIAVTSKPIVSLAAAGGVVAYRSHFTDGFGGVCNSVHMLSLGGGGESVPKRCSAGGSNDHGRGLALGPHALYYDSIEVEPENATHDGAEAVLWRVGGGAPVKLADENYEITCSGSGIGPFAYAAGVAFTRTVMTEVDPAMECQLGSGGGPGVSSMTAATMQYVPSGSTVATPLAGAPGAARIAARWPILAIVPLRLPQPMGNHVAPPTQGTDAIELWNLRTRAHRCTANLAGLPAAVAANGAQVGAIVRTPHGTSLARLSTANCVHTSVRILAGRVQPELAMGRHVVAWVSGRSVLALDLRTHGVSRLYRGALVPHGLSLSNGQLVWWITGRAGGSRVLRLALP
jgi:hypothetical protein